MPRISSFGFHSLAKVNKLHFMLPILFTIILAIFFAFFVLSLAFQGFPSSLFAGDNKFFVELNIFIIVGVSLTSLIIFFYYFRKRPELAVRLFVASFILSGILSTLLFVKLVFTSMSLEFPLILLIVALITYVGAYFAYLILVDSLSDRTRNLLFVFCSAALGSFVGIIVPPFLVIGISLCLSVVDLFLIKRKTLEQFVGKAGYEKILSQVAFSSKQWGIGIGDLTCYSIVVANTLLNFGFIAGGLSVLMVLVGSFMSLILTLRMIRVPGLPISITLGLLPSIILSFL